MEKYNCFILTKPNRSNMLNIFNSKVCELFGYNVIFFTNQKYNIFSCFILCEINVFLDSENGRKEKNFMMNSVTVYSMVR